MNDTLELEDPLAGLKIEEDSKGRSFLLPEKPDPRRLVSVDVDVVVRALRFFEALKANPGTNCHVVDRLHADVLQAFEAWNAGWPRRAAIALAQQGSHEKQA